MNENHELKPNVGVQEIVTDQQLKETGTIMEDVGELSPEESQQIKALRALNEKRKECAVEIDQVLKKHNAVLAIDPNSSYSNPQIIIQLRQ